MKRKCPSCGSENLEPGTIQSTGRVNFRPNNAAFLTFKSADIDVQGSICTDCGYILLVGDGDKVKELVASSEATA